MFLTPERAMPAITPFNSSNSFYKKTMFELKRYSPADAAEWNAFVAGSKNGTFLSTAVTWTTMPTDFVTTRL